MRWVLLTPDKIAIKPVKVAVIKIKNPRKPEKNITTMARKIRIKIDKYL